MIVHREARRVNSFVRSQKQFRENLQYLLNERGMKSEAFPKTVKDLQELEGQPNISRSRRLWATHPPISQLGRSWSLSSSMVWRPQTGHPKFRT